MPPPAASKEGITTELRRLGLQLGDLLIAHSSLRAFGWVPGGAEAVVEALLDTVGPAGTVLVPTFNHSRVKVFDLETTPSDNGAVTEALRKRPGAIRSLHPTHPYAALGRDAPELTSGHLEVGTFDPKSPLGKLADGGGWVVLLGVGMDASTAIHVGQASAQAHCLGYGLERSLIRLGGEVREVRTTLWRDGECPLETKPVETRLRQRNLIRDGLVGKAVVHVMRAADVIAVTMELCAETCPTCLVQPEWSSPRAIGPR
jgi:aminoglycoside 3-N-acetyltransferase